MKMKIYVTGYKGKLGRRLVSLGAFPLKVDITKEAVVDNAINVHKPDLIIHAAAKSSVDFCQQRQNEAWDVNVVGAVNVFKSANIINVPVLFLSSEQVFSGWWGRYKEEAKGKPKNYYGATKWMSEALAQIWDHKILRLSRCVEIADKDIEGAFVCMESRKFSAPSFFYRNYQHADFLAEQIWWCANNYHKLPEILNIGGDTYLSWYDFVGKLAKANGYTGRIIKRRKDFKQFAPRPHRCGFNLSKAKRLGVPMYSVNDTIRLLINEKNRNSGS